MRDAYAAHEAELAAARIVTASAELAAADLAREAGRAAVDGEGHRQVRQVLAQRAATAAAERKAAGIRAEHTARAETVARARNAR